MDTAEFEPYIENLVRSYAEGHIRAGRWTEANGLAESRKEVNGLLPAGLATPDQFLFSVVADPGGEKVGVAWLAIQPRGAFVYDIEIVPSSRGKGFGEEAMRLLEGVAREKGAKKLMLHVFGDNLVARKLYTKLGFVETGVAMAKTLAP